MLLGELDRATQRFGLAAPSGIVSHTGIGGLTLGGGLGHTMRKFGLTVDNLRSVDLVTADGEALHVDAWTEPELFWGCAAAAATSGSPPPSSTGCSPVGPLLLCGPIFWPLADAPEVLRFVREFAPQAPDELGLVLFARLAPAGAAGAPGALRPAGPGASARLGRRPCRGAAGGRAAAPGRPAHRRQPAALPYLFLQSMVDAGNQHGMRWYWRSQRVPELADDVVDVLAG